MTEQLRAITLTQPWAQAIPLGLKRIETRDWKSDELVGDLLAIHAAKGFNGLRDLGVPKTIRGYCEFMRREPYNTIFRGTDLVVQTTVVPTEGEPYQEWEPTAFGPDRGFIVAVARLAAIVPTEEMRPRLEAAGRTTELALGNYDPGRFAWVLHDIVPMRLEARGGRRIWWVPRDVSDTARAIWGRDHGSK